MPARHWHLRYVGLKAWPNRCKTICNVPTATWLTRTHLDIYQDMWEGVKHSCIGLLDTSRYLPARYVEGSEAFMHGIVAGTSIHGE